MSRKSVILLVYLVLLAASFLVRRLRDDGAPRPGGGPESMSVAEIADGEPTDRVVTLAYHDRPAATENAPVIVMLHGSPGAAGQVMGLSRSLEGRFRILAPDLPGFGGSTSRIADYSIIAHARYVEAFLDELGINEAHFVGFSLGGGVALEIANSSPQRVQSISLIGSVGVQELELLGDYTLNHAVHGLQLGVLWFAFEGFPHFGFFDGSMFDVAYARNFFDTDQRPLRGILEKYEGPMLIVHGEEDFLVPVSAAREHARIVPQSELLVFKDGHFRIFTDPGSMAKPVAEFVNRVETGTAITRATAEPARIETAMAPFDFRLHGEPRPIGILPMGVLLASATLITEDLACISAGILASKGAIPFWAGALACFLGIFFGDFLLYIAGRALGRDALAKAPLKWFVTEEQVERSAHFFHEYGPSLILTTRFIPGTRLPTYVTAGLLGTGFWRFAGWFFLAGALWVPLIVFISMLIGGRMIDWFQRFEELALAGLLAAVLTLYLVIRIGFPLFNPSGRRLLLGSWRRITRWEFWPMWMIYPPVVAHILWLGCRHRCLTLFTAANPGIPEGGLADESKADILRAFGDDVPEIASFCLIARDLDAAEKTRALENFMTEKRLDFPVVLKPDTGERGEGVSVVRDHAQAEAYFRECPFDVIAQEYVEGEEFGIFYCRYPDEERGWIFSITDKRLIGVTGDGERSLEKLILDDDRAVCMGSFFLKKFASRLDGVPAAGEFFPLTELGTHCRGALFLDGGELVTDALTDSIDALSKRFEGFYFGRYDVRAASREALREGTGFKVLELNGVTSEATHIYDPSHSLRSARRTLREQWKIAFDIGAQNVKKGVVPTSLTELARVVQQYRHRKKFEV